MENIGKYRIVAHIGQGGMARVFLTLSEGQHGVQKLLVVKELREQLAEDPELLASFLHEARIAARLNHPNIVQTYEAGSDGQRHFIAMEYLEGQPLSAIFRSIGREHVPLALHLRVLSDMLEGLEYAHTLRDYGGGELHVIHRDVSPQNVFVTYEGQVKVVDFGIAKIAGSASHTQAGRMKGKLSYIAPEQARCEDVDARSDVFAAGMMLWEALAGRRLSRGDDEASLLSRRIMGEDPKIREVAPHVPDALADICDRATALDPNERFASAGEFQAALETFAAESGNTMSNRELGRTVAERFVTERARIRKAIQDQVENIDTLNEPINLDLVPVNLKATNESNPRVSTTGLTPESMPIVTGMALAQASNMPPPRRARSIWPLLAIGAVTSLATIAFALLVIPRDQDTEIPRSPAGSETQHHLVIHYPEGAVASLDGRTLSENPYRAEVAAGDADHELVVEQSGHKTVRQALKYDRDLTLHIALTQVKLSPTTVPTATATSTAEAPAPPVARWVPRPPPPALPTTATTEPPPTKPPPSGTVHIDEQNPYKKKP